MADRIPLRWLGNLLLLGVAVVGLAWFWSYRAVGLISIESGSAQVLFRQRLCILHENANMLVLGNSLAGEGFLVNHFNGRANEHFALNLAVPSAHWFLLERLAEMAREAGLRPRVVVLMTAPEHFSERLDFDFLENDLTLAKPLLGGADLKRLAGHTATPLRYAEYAPRIVLRPLLYRGELRSLLLSPAKHREQTERLRVHLLGMRSDVGMVENGNGFSACDAGPLKTLESRLPALRAANDPRIGEYERTVAGLRARAGVPMAVDAREVWRFRRVLELLRGMSRRVIVAPAPYYDPDYAQYPEAFREEMQQSIAATVKAVPGAELAPALETDCSDFMDTVHFNRKGATRFTDGLLRAIEGEGMARGEALARERTGAVRGL